MRVRIAEHVVLVGALAPGQDLAAGEVVTLDEATAAAWIARGWAVPAPEDGEEPAGSRQ
jgi:hypothetical protein